MKPDMPIDHPRRSGWRTVAAAAGLCLVAALAPVPGLAADAAPDAEASERWQSLRKDLFGARPFEKDSAAVIELEAPDRAEDAATVPIAIRTRIGQTPQRYVKTIFLVIDKNPSPVGAIFRLTPESGRADIETRVRVEDYSHMRAIAETSDGKLYAATRYVKASGGCSAPAGKDQAAAMASLGKMRLRLEETVKQGQPALAQVMVSHPNSSGLAMDQVTRLYAPAYFVRKVAVSYAGRPIMTAEVDFTISENPNFRFWFVPKGEGELKAEVVDTNDLSFTSTLMVKPKDGG